MIERLEPFYDATLRRVGPLHAVLRDAVYAAGSLVVRAGSAVARFELPADGMLPLYQLPFLLGTYERGTVRAVRALLKPGMVAIDAGAHAGYYTLLFSRLVGPRGSVLAFEPHPDTFAVLARNVRRRGLANVRLFEAAVSDREGQAALWLTPLSVGHSLLPAKAAATDARRVATTTLDAVARAHALARADLVKVDVEGAEVEALEGLRELAARSPGLAVVLEYKPELLRARGEDLPALLARLEGLGYGEAWALSDHAPPRRLAPQDPALRAFPKCNLLVRRA